MSSPPSDPGLPGCRIVAPGIVRVSYASPEALLPEHQDPVLQALRDQSASGPVGILFDLAAAVRSVDLSVPSFWLAVTGERSYQLAAMAMVTHSTAVRVAAKGFSAANVLRGIKLAVETFTDEAAALSWLQTVVRL